MNNIKKNNRHILTAMRFTHVKESTIPKCKYFSLFLIWFICSGFRLSLTWFAADLDFD